MKKWRCTVCGYIHTGEEPPDVCPVCKADRSKFVEMIEEVDDANPQAPESSAPRFYNYLADFLYKNHAHPISVHFPNGVLPVTVVFVALTLFTGYAALGEAAYFNLIAVFLAMPLVLLSGFISWKKRYKGMVTRTFVTKIVCGSIVTLIALILLIWRYNDPGVLHSDSPARWLFLVMHFFMLAAAGLAGHLGGKLVFGKR